MDMSYATIHVFGQPRRLYKETLMSYMVSNKEMPNNNLIYSVHSNMDSFILYNHLCLEEEIQNMVNLLEEKESDLQENKSEHKDEYDGLWNIDFDGVVSKEGVGAGLLIVIPKMDKSKLCSFKLFFLLRKQCSQI